MMQACSSLHFTTYTLLMISLVAPCVQAEELKDDLHLVEKIRALILKKSTISKESEMKDYQAPIPKTGLPYDMIAIKSGTFLMGSPEDEQGRQKDEGPQHKVKVEAFWMGKFEVTWDQFDPFMSTDTPRGKNGFPEKLPVNPNLDFLVSAPTTAYMKMDFGMGYKGYPAISMTQHAASKFCQWLSAQTGHYYRLPTEAEWEYACRAGTKSTYYFGNTSKNIKDFEVVDAYQYARVGTKKPNPWGLYDMHGNVLEWCLDQYLPNSYASKVQTIPAQKLYPRVLRGGSWYDYSDDCRSATRSHSQINLKMSDPEWPRSLWYHTDAEWLGFRIVRPLKLPSAERMFQLWNSGNIEDRTTLQ